MRDDLDIPMPAMGPAAGGGSYRVPRQREAADPHTKRLAMIAAGIGGTLVVLLGAWSMTGHRRTGVPVVEADARPVREKPTNAGGMQVAGKDEAILSGKADGQAALAPPAEAPRPDALKAQEQAAAAAASAAQTPVQTAVPAALPAPVAMQAPPTPAVPRVAPSPHPASPAPRTPVQAMPAAPVALAPPAATAAVKPPVAVPAKPAVVAAAPAAAPSAAAAPMAAAKPAARPAGTAQVQLAAVGSEQAAMQEWQRLEKKAPALFGGHKPVVSKTERDGKTFWRLRATGFADATAAKGFCEQAKTKGLACTVMAL